MLTVTLTLLPDGTAAVMLPHGRRGEPAPYPVRFGAGGAVILTSPEGAVYCVERKAGLWSCPCDAWKYSPATEKICKHVRASHLLQRWLDAVAVEDLT